MCSIFSWRNFSRPFSYLKIFSLFFSFRVRFRAIFTKKLFLNRYRLRNKKINATVRTFPLLNKVGVNNTVTTTAGNVISVIGSTETTGKIVPSTNGISNSENSVSQLIPRSTDSTLRALETVKKVGKVGTNGQNASGPSAESVTEK